MKVDEERIELIKAVIELITACITLIAAVLTAKPKGKPTKTAKRRKRKR